MNLEHWADANDAPARPLFTILPATHVAIKKLRARGQVRGGGGARFLSPGT